MVWLGVLVVVVLFFGLMIADFNSQRRTGKLKEMQVVSQASLDTNCLSDRQIQEELLKASRRIEKQLTAIRWGIAAICVFFLFGGFTVVVKVF